MAITQTTYLLIDHLDPGQNNKDITLNDGFDDYDAAIAGVLAKTMGSVATFTLTTTEAQNAVIICSGAPGGVPTLELSLNKTYIVKNNLTGGHSLTVKGTAAGSTTVLNGNTAIFYVTGNVATRVFTGTDLLSAPFLLNGPNVAGYGLSGSVVDVSAIGATLTFRSNNTAAVPLVVGAASGQAADIFEVKAFGSTNHFLINNSGTVILNSKQIQGLANASVSTDALPKGQADGLYAPIGSAYLTVGSDATLTNETNISSLASTLKFVASGGGVTAFAVKAGSAPSVDVFQVQDNSNVVQWAVNSSFEMDAKTHKIKNVVDPAAAQDAATKNYNDTTTGYSVLNFCADSLTTSVGTTYFAWVNFITTVAGVTERWIPVPAVGKISNLRVIAAIAPAGGSVQFTVRKKAVAGGVGAGSDTALTCTMGATTTEAHDTTNSFTVVAGDEISVKIVEQAGYSGSAARIMISMEITLA